MFVCLSDCEDIKQYTSDWSGDGFYSLFPSTVTQAFDVYCRHITSTRTYLLDRRKSSSDFNLSYQEYVDGFWYSNGDFWVGLKNVSFVINSIIVTVCGLWLLKLYLCVCVCLCVSVCPAFTAYMSLTMGRSLIKLGDNVGTSVRLIVLLFFRKLYYLITSYKFFLHISLLTCIVYILAL